MTGRLPQRGNSGLVSSVYPHWVGTRPGEQHPLLALRQWPKPQHPGSPQLVLKQRPASTVQHTE
jgi:hypothetical protein